MRSFALRTILASLAVVTFCGFKLQIKNGKLQVEGGNKTSSQPANRNTASAIPAADPKPAGGVCNAQQSIGLCYLFVGKKNAENQTSQGNQMACKLFKGQFSAGDPCPQPNRLGTCTIKGGAPDEYRLIYYPTQNFDAGKAQSDCVNPKSSIHVQGAGTWQPG